MYLLLFTEKEYARVTFSSVSGGSLFTAAHLRAMCRIEKDKIRPHTAFDDTCVRYTHSHRCCSSWSLPNYVALLSNRTTCHDVTDADVASVTSLIQECARHYRSLHLTANCYEFSPNESNNCRSVPPRCQKYNAVYNILHYLTDVDFLPPAPSSRKGEKGSGTFTSSSVPKLSLAMTFLPVAAGSASEPLFKAMENELLIEGDTELVAINFAIKHNLFDYYLLTDTVWFSMALGVILLLMWAYTASLFITAMTVVSIFLSLAIAYFFYTMVFSIEFFPFMNLLTVVILVGVGADDVFIYCKVWSLAKLEKNVGTLEKIVSDTLRHATLSMFVTSLTTAAAFFANYVSSITALRCFAIYAGTTLIVNYLLMVTWTPAVIVIYEKWCSDCLTCYSPDIYTPKRGFCFYFCKLPYKVYYLLSDWARIYFEKILPCLVVKPRFVWLVLFGSMGIAGIVIVFYKPRLKLPSSNEFQVFSSDHPFEVYDFKVKDRFSFEKAAGSYMAAMPLTITWGMKPVDTGDYLDPFSEGTLVEDPGFNIATPKAQEWLLKFCSNLRQTKLFQPSPGPQLTNCFIENFKKFMEQDCISPIGSRNNPCCRDSKFPYKEDVFRHCIKVYEPLLSKTPIMYFSSLDAGLRYSKKTGKLVALIVEVNSNQPFSFNHTSMQVFYTTMNQWVNEQMLHAPQEMRGGWFVSHLDFYDLQETLAQDTPVAIGVSITVATVVSFFTTLNLLISLYAMVSITGAIFVTVGSLVLMGWELNILEAVVITIAVGLSMDFSLHYGMAYRLSPDLDREMRVCCSLARMGSPVAMAALTTFLAGALMMPSTVLAYRQLGTFLMLAMSVSWLYGTFFFQSLLRTFGPQGGFGQFHWPSWDCCSGSGREHVDKTVYALSESTVSTSSTNHANSSETHELEPLTERDQKVAQHHPRHKALHHHPPHHLHNHHHHPQYPAKVLAARHKNNNKAMPDQEQRNGKCDTLVTIDCQADQRPLVVAANNFHNNTKNAQDCLRSPDDVTGQTLLHNEHDESDSCELLTQNNKRLSQGSDGGEVWRKLPELI